MRCADTLYSYYCVCNDGAAIIEDLESHSARVVKHLGMLRGSPISRYAAMKSGVREDVFVEALLVAGALHDVGKAFYQRNLRKEDNGCEHLSFMGHEWISAYFVHQLWKYLQPGSTDVEEVMDVIFYAVLLHHHAMDLRQRAHGLIDRLKPPRKDIVVRGLNKIGSLIRDDVVRNTYLNILTRAVDNVLKFTGKEPADLINEVFAIYRRTFKEHVGIRGRRVLYLLATSALVVADYLAAGEVRGPSSSRFWHVVREFSEAYFNKLGNCC